MRVLMRRWTSSLSFVFILTGTICGWSQENPSGFSNLTSTITPTLLVEPLSADWEVRLLPPLLHRLLRVAPYALTRASAPEALQAILAESHRLALLRRASAHLTDTNVGIEWLEFGPATCLVLAVRKDSEWMKYSDLNYGHPAALRVDAVDTLAYQQFAQVVAEFPLLGALKTQIQPIPSAIQRLATQDSDLIAFTVPRRAGDDLPPQIIRQLLKTGLRLLEIPPVLTLHAHNLFAGEVLLSTRWLWQAPRIYHTLCDPFVLAMPAPQAKNLISAILHEPSEDGDIEAAPPSLTALPSSEAQSLELKPVVNNKQPQPVIQPEHHEAPVITSSIQQSHEVTHEVAIETIQQRLNELGFATGRPDGRLGPQTKQAIRQFQQAQGMTVTGVIDQDLIKKIQQISNKSL